MYTHTHVYTIIITTLNLALYGALDGRHDLKWRFPKKTKITGVYDDFSTLARDQENKAESEPIVRFSIVLHINFFCDSSNKYILDWPLDL